MSDRHCAGTTALLLHRAPTKHEPAGMPCANATAVLPPVDPLNICRHLTRCRLSRSMCQSLCTPAWSQGLPAEVLLNMFEPSAFGMVVPDPQAFRKGCLSGASRYFQNSLGKPVKRVARSSKHVLMCICHSNWWSLLAAFSGAPAVEGRQVFSMHAAIVILAYQEAMPDVCQQHGCLIVLAGLLLEKRSLWGQQCNGVPTWSLLLACVIVGLVWSLWILQLQLWQSCSSLGAHVATTSLNINGAGHAR